MRVNNLQPRSQNNEQFEAVNQLNELLDKKLITVKNCFDIDSKMMNPIKINAKKSKDWSRASKYISSNGKIYSLRTKNCQQNTHDLILSLQKLNQSDNESSPQSQFQINNSDYQLKNQNYLTPKKKHKYRYKKHSETGNLDITLKNKSFVTEFSRVIQLNKFEMVKDKSSSFMSSFQILPDFSLKATFDNDKFQDYPSYNYKFNLNQYQGSDLFVNTKHEYFNEVSRLREMITNFTQEENSIQQNQRWKIQDNYFSNNLDNIEMFNVDRGLMVEQDSDINPLQSISIIINDFNEKFDVSPQETSAKMFENQPESTYIKIIENKKQKKHKKVFTGSINFMEDDEENEEDLKPGVFSNKKSKQKTHRFISKDPQLFSCNSRQKDIQRIFNPLYEYQSKWHYQLSSATKSKDEIKQNILSKYRQKLKKTPKNQDQYQEQQQYFSQQALSQGLKRGGYELKYNDQGQVIYPNLPEILEPSKYHRFGKMQHDFDQIRKKRMLNLDNRQIFHKLSELTHDKSISLIDAIKLDYIDQPQFIPKRIVDLVHYCSKNVIKIIHQQSHPQ